MAAARRPSSARLQRTPDSRSIPAGCAVAIPLSQPGTDKEVQDVYKKHRIVGGGGVQLHAVETGNPRGRPIVFIHGFSQMRHGLEPTNAAPNWRTPSDSWRWICAAMGFRINRSRAMPIRKCGRTTSMPSFAHSASTILCCVVGPMDHSSSSITSVITVRTTSAVPTSLGE